MSHYIFLPLFGLLGTLVLLQAVEIVKLQQRVKALEDKSLKKTKK